ncbi:MAG: DUF58 domain-containing protein [bacterium]|nr:DUF58 domain-containing protein [bacterium]
MIPIPQGRLLLVLIIPLGVMIAGMFSPEFLNIAIAIDLLVLCAVIFDFLFSRSLHPLKITPDQSRLFSIGRTNYFSVKVYNPSRLSQSFLCTLSFPDSFENKTKLASYTIEPGVERVITYTIRPTRRGAFVLEHLFFRINSRFRLFHLSRKEKIDAAIDVYPDIKSLNHFLKLTRKDRTYELGVNKNRWKGMGTDLESLRDYQSDDDSRHIDWKASTRLNKPLTKVFQMESNNHITLAVDCGRLMTAEQNGLNTLDHAVNSLLILSHIAFKAGDTISVIAFSDRIIGELYDVKGKASLNKITRFITGLQPEYVESNYSYIFRYLHKKVKRRSLIVFLTDMIDDINYSVFKTGITQLSRKHLVLFILLRDIILSNHANAEALSVDDAYTAAAAREMFLNRNNAISKLKLNKVNVLDVLPQQLTAKLINKYLELKSKNRL